MKYFINNVKGESTKISEATGCQTNFCHENKLPEILLFLSA